MSAPVQPAASDARPDRVEDVTRVIDGIRRVLRALRVANAAAERTTGLSAAQLFVLARAAEQPGASIAELASQTMTDRSSVAAVVERLAGAGLVERRSSPTDRRRVDVVPTAAGLDVLARAPHLPTTLLLEAMDGMDAQEIAQLSGGLRALVGAMGLADAPATFMFEDARDG